MVAVLTFAGFLAIANAVWSRAETYFERAAYLTSCTPSATSPATPAQCRELADAPDHLAQAPLNDEALTLSYAATLHSTGTAVMTLGGIVVSLLVGVTGWLVAAAKDP